MFDAVVFHAVTATSGHVLPQLLELCGAQASLGREEGNEQIEEGEDEEKEREGTLKLQYIVSMRLLN